MTDSDERPERWKPVEPMDGCTFSGYEASDKAQARSIDRMSGNRQLRGKTLSTRLDGDGYVLVDLRCDSTDPAHKRKHTLLMHKVVLTTFDKPCPEGMETCHSDRGPAFNWWPEGIRWGTKPENHADMVAAGTAVIPEPSFECVNFLTCGNMVRTSGRRCFPCVQDVGRAAAGMLNGGQPLDKVAERFGNSADWIFRLAAEHGGYEGTRTQARLQGIRSVHHEPCRCPECQPPAPRRNRLLSVVTFGRVGRRSGAGHAPHTGPGRAEVTHSD